MARQQKMIRSKASVPVGIFVGDDTDVVHDNLFDGIRIERLGLIEVVNHFCDAEWKKMNMRYVRVTCSELGICFQVINKSSFRRIYDPAGDRRGKVVPHLLYKQIS